jgi:tetratricopeptide (TPR) repeat protein
MWHLAVAAYVQGWGAETPVGIFCPQWTRRVRDRFGDRPEIRLSQALISSRAVHKLYAEGRYFDEAPPVLPTYVSYLSNAVDAFKPLVQIGVIRAEAALNLGFFKTAQGKKAEALRLFDEVLESTDDGWLRYCAFLLRGRVQFEQGRVLEAVGDFEGALATHPKAASAARWLAAVRYVRGERKQALSILDTLLQEPANDDPWPWFAYGEYRHWPKRRGQLREYLR